MTASTRKVSPLADWAARFPAVSHDPAAFAMREVPFVGQVNLRGDAADAAFGSKVHGLLGANLPVAANTWNTGSDCQVLWLGPDEWLVTAPDGRNEALCAALRAALQGIHHSVTDVSANRTVIELSGANARLVLAKGCPLDLHASAFKAPQCAQSVLAKSQVILQCVDARPVFRLFVRPSFAPYVAEWLVDAATELHASRGIDTGRIARGLN